jgi:hypothetical protein
MDPARPPRMRFMGVKPLAIVVLPQVSWETEEAWTEVPALRHGVLLYLANIAANGRASNTTRIAVILSPVT